MDIRNCKAYLNPVDGYILYSEFPVSFERACDWKFAGSADYPDSISGFFTDLLAKAGKLEMASLFPRLLSLSFETFLKRSFGLFVRAEPFDSNCDFVRMFWLRAPKFRAHSS